jgi:hypothetical protein
MDHELRWATSVAVYASFATAGLVAVLVASDSLSAMWFLIVPVVGVLVSGALLGATQMGWDAGGAPAGSGSLGEGVAGNDPGALREVLVRHAVLTAQLHAEQRREERVDYEIRSLGQAMQGAKADDLGYATVYLGPRRVRARLKALERTRRRIERRIGRFAAELAVPEGLLMIYAHEKGIAAPESLPHDELLRRLLNDEAAPAA